MLYIIGREQNKGMYNFDCDWQFEAFCHAHICLSRIQHGAR